MYCVSLKVYAEGVKLSELSIPGSVIQRFSVDTFLQDVCDDGVFSCNSLIFTGSRCERSGCDCRGKVNIKKLKVTNENRKIHAKKLDGDHEKRKVSTENLLLGNDKRNLANEKRMVDSQKRLGGHAERKTANQKMEMGHGKFKIANRKMIGRNRKLKMSNQKMKVGDIKWQIGFENRMEGHPARWGNDQKRYQGFSEPFGR